MPPISQNGVIHGFLDDADQHVPGEHLVVRLCASLRRGGWSASDPEDWRDSGWSMLLTRDDAKLEVVLSSVRDAQSLVQIAPCYAPGVFGRLLKKKSSASVEAVLLLSRAVSAFLAQAGYTEQRWCWDGYPGDDAAMEPPGA